ncbi:MAG: class I tRNA ligase family protein, partial [Acidobacteria bacterium]|nr:class I tRNA ligase family protein [Acidobacteriota bacterium]
WIISRFHRTAEQVNAALAGYRFHEAAGEVYHFFWDEFCDWYIELLKLRFQFEDAAAADAARSALASAFTVFEAALRLLSPFMPFITEELWQALNAGRPAAKSIAMVGFPEADARQFDLGAEGRMAILQDLITTVRNLRAELKIEPRERVHVQVFAGAEVRELLAENQRAISRLASVANIAWVDTSLAGAPGARSTARFEVAVLYERRIDAAAERERLSRELAKFQQELARANAQLANEGFLAKAPPRVVDGLRTRAAELQSLVEKTARAMNRSAAE